MRAPMNLGLALVLIVFNNFMVVAAGNDSSPSFRAVTILLVVLVVILLVVFIVLVVVFCVRRHDRRIRRGRRHESRANLRPNGIFFTRTKKTESSQLKMDDIERGHQHRGHAKHRETDGGAHAQQNARKSVAPKHQTAPPPLMTELQGPIVREVTVNQHQLNRGFVGDMEEIEPNITYSNSEARQGCNHVAEQPPRRGFTADLNKDDSGKKERRVEAAAVVKREIAALYLGPEGTPRGKCTGAHGATAIANFAAMNENVNSMLTYAFDSALSQDIVRRATAEVPREKATTYCNEQRVRLPTLFNTLIGKPDDDEVALSSGYSGSQRSTTYYACAAPSRIPTPVMGTRASSRAASGSTSRATSRATEWRTRPGNTPSSVISRTPSRIPTPMKSEANVKPRKEVEVHASPASDSDDAASRRTGSGDTTLAVADSAPRFSGWQDRASSPLIRSEDGDFFEMPALHGGRSASGAQSRQDTSRASTNMSSIPARLPHSRHAAKTRSSRFSTTDDNGETSSDEGRRRRRPRSKKAPKPISQQRTTASRPASDKESMPLAMMY